MKSMKNVSGMIARVRATFTLSLFTLSGCIRSVEINPEEALAEGSYRGNVRVEDAKGVIYNAQAISETEEGDYLLEMVDVIDDGVVDREIEVVLAKADVVSIKYTENNRWATVGLVGGVSLFMVWLYYKINTSVFD